MAIAKAVIIGAVAAIAIPWALHGHSGDLGTWVQRGLVTFSAGGFAFRWSWPLFCAVTLFAWGFLAWSDR